MSGLNVIHKQVIRLQKAEELELQILEVPSDARMVDIQWDSSDPIGVGFWYQTHVPIPDARPLGYKRWRIRVVRTGEPYPAEAVHLTTVVRNETVWHVIDLDGRVEWAEV